MGLIQENFQYYKMQNYKARKKQNTGYTEENEHCVKNNDF